ncbi:DUF805 domain-containing protein [Thiohalocapsa marina]|uniref:DUF805 domain-containing protein n=1 Tax=Thiohalocapsa marina TaxID=424902 RepID=A0A5M8FI77_9GAMM|nr:DUF805 domain-containing protein [Thiohalocapsa marina]KAA6184389.1 DUF805 domain-containing protein [Thiohalocapsa marina]
MNWYLAVLKKYTVFSGRAQRAEYWYFTLFNLLIAIGLGLVDSSLGTLNPETGYGLFSGLYIILVLIPSLGVGVRRLHDTGRTGWWILVGLIPVIGTLILIFFFVQDSTPGSNAHGPNPKGVTA